MTRFAVAFAGALISAVGFAGGAHAVTLVDTTGYVGTLPSITIDGETFIEQSCTVTLCNGLQMLQDGSNLGVTISAVSGGSIISGSFPTGADLGLELSVGGTAKISAVGLALTGNNGGVSANNAAIGFGETINTSPVTLGGQTLATGSETWLSLPSGYSSLDLTKDIYVHGYALQSGSTGAVTTVTQDLQLLAVPEPATIAVLLSGLVAFAGSRRFRRRS